MNNSFSKDDTLKIKGFAIIAMILHHCFLSPERYTGKVVSFVPFSEHFINYFALALKICVAIFTFLSAYGMTLSYKKLYDSDNGLNVKNINRTIYRRLVKLLSAYLFIIISANLYSLVIVRDDRFHTVYGHGIKSFLFFFVDCLGLAELFSSPTYLATFWYISLAIIVIFLVPAFIHIYRYMGAPFLLFFTVLISVLFPITNSRTYAYLPAYAFTVAVGVVVADKDLIVKMCGFDAHKAVKFFLYILFLLILIYFRQLTRKTTILAFWDGAISLFISAFFMEFINRIPVIKTTLKFIGNHATNIFLTHNFIRIVWYYDFTYSFRHWMLIALVLLLLSLLLSILIEFVKKILKYNNLIDYLLALPK
jgi:hypothetical protein